MVLNTKTCENEEVKPNKVRRANSNPEKFQLMHIVSSAIDSFFFFFFFLLPLKDQGIFYIPYESETGKHTPRSLLNQLWNTG